MKEHRFPYKWTLKDANFTKDKGTVFSCFACGGGSTMGYKLAGFDVIGCNEIDPKMMEAYRTNHKPKYSYLEPIQTFKLRKDLPKELYNLDILDGSPPCSSFSMAGNREKDWGKEKKFREGQAEQVLDNLFFDFIDLAKELQPKVVVAENVKGLMLGNAKEYVRRIYKAFKAAGYELRIAPYLLDASKMGVPQRRERVFFIALRKDLANPFMEQIDMFQSAPKLELNFNEPGISYGEVECGHVEEFEKISPCDLLYYDECKPGDSIASVHPKGHRFNSIKLNKNTVSNTIAAGSDIFHYEQKRKLTKNELCKIGSYPMDYNFLTNKPIYLIGMSVPPVLVANMSNEIYQQWLIMIELFCILNIIL
jgi:DNA (cytosine-5)-methyltransferase 1